MLAWPVLASPAEPDPVAHVLARLALMEGVAAAKTARGSPILDPDREARVLADVATQAARFGLEPAAAVTAFEAQLALARAAQARAIARWQAGDPLPSPLPDLDADLRPRISAAGTDQLRDWARSPLPPGPALLDRLERALRRDGHDAAQVAALRTALAGLGHRVADNATGMLEFIAARAELRVGMAGDYAPFAVRTAAGDWLGADVVLARDMAAAHGVPLRIVPTSWATLAADLRHGAFDLAMGGITRTPERARVGLFSVPYARTGKLPIVRCADVERFATDAGLDHPGTRAIVNPGGTNEAFMRAHLKHARLRVHPDNVTVFDEIVAGRADVMFTDDIEVRLQSLRHPGLCAARERPLTRQDKAVLLPRDPALAGWVSVWLEGQLASGRIARLLDAEVAAAAAR